MMWSTTCFFSLTDRCYILRLISFSFKCFFFWGGGFTFQNIRFLEAIDDSSPVFPLECLSSDTVKQWNKRVRTETNKMAICPKEHDKRLFSWKIQTRCNIFRQQSHAGVTYDFCCVFSFHVIANHFSIDFTHFFFIVLATPFFQYCVMQMRVTKRCVFFSMFFIFAQKSSKRSCELEDQLSHRVKKPTSPPSFLLKNVHTHIFLFFFKVGGGGFPSPPPAFFFKQRKKMMRFLCTCRGKTG